MKILILANDIEGLYQFRKELLYKFLDLKYNVIISVPNIDKSKYTSRFKKKGISILETKIDRRGKNIFKDLQLLFNYLKIIRNEDPDYILTYTIKPNIYGSIAAKILKKKYINNITGLGTSLQNKGILAKILRKMYKIALSNSECIFFQNITNKEYFIQNKILNKNTKVKLIPGSGVNLEQFYPLDNINKDNIKRFLFIGRLMDEKGINEYIECAKNLKEKKLNIEFQILGNFEEEKYKEIIKDLEKNGIIKYLGVSNDVREQIKNVDCIINPSWHEGMSNVLLEAGAMKKFLIASNISGCKEIVINNITGLTFQVKVKNELTKKIIEYLNMDCEHKNKIIENLYTHINKKFDRNVVIQKYIEIIQKVENK